MMAGGFAFDSAAAERCLNEVKLATQACNQFAPAQLRDCSRIVVGMTPPGGACSDTLECASVPGMSVYCSDGGICAGSMLDTRGARGDACADSCDTQGSCMGIQGATAISVGCYEVDGLYCSAASFVCTAISASGGPCSSDGGCMAPDTCVFDTSAQAAHLEPGHCGFPTSNGPFATQYSCLSQPDPNQN